MRVGEGTSLQNSRIDELSPRNMNYAPSNFDKIYIIIVYWEEIFARYCIQSNNDHFHPQFVTIVFTIKSSSFSVVYN